VNGGDVVPESDDPERYIFGTLAVLGVGIHLLATGVAATLAVVERSLFFLGFAIAFAARGYRTIALYRTRRSSSADSDIQRLFRNVGIAYGVGGALCILSSVLGEGMSGLLLGSLIAGAGAMLALLPRLQVHIREWPSRWVP
jgi:hypothetical protein